MGDDIIKVEKGKALIINGAQGVGKSTLARCIAKNHGGFESVNLERLTHPFALSNVKQGEPYTFIIEEFKPTNKNMAFINSIVERETIKVGKLGEWPFEVETPNFILCVQSDTPLELTSNAERFSVIMVSLKV